MDHEFDASELTDEQRKALYDAVMDYRAGCVRGKADFLEWLGVDITRRQEWLFTVRMTADVPQHITQTEIADAIAQALDEQYLTVDGEELENMGEEWEVQAAPSPTPPAQEHNPPQHLMAHNPAPLLRWVNADNMRQESAARRLPTGELYLLRLAVSTEIPPRVRQQREAFQLVAVTRQGLRGHYINLESGDRITNLFTVRFTSLVGLCRQGPNTIGNRRNISQGGL